MRAIDDTTWRVIWNILALVDAVVQALWILVLLYWSRRNRRKARIALQRGGRCELQGGFASISGMDSRGPGMPPPTMAFKGEKSAKSTSHSDDKLTLSPEVQEQPPPEEEKMLDFLILPVYYRFLQLEALGCVGWVLLVGGVLIGGNQLYGPTAHPDLVAKALWAGGMAFVMALTAGLHEGIMVFLVQRSAGKVALKRTIRFAVLWAIIGFLAGFAIVYLWNEQTTMKLLQNPHVGCYATRFGMMWLFHASIQVLACYSSYATHRMGGRRHSEPSTSSRSEGRSETLTTSSSYSYIQRNVSTASINMRDHSNNPCFKPCISLTRSSWRVMNICQLIISTIAIVAVVMSVIVDPNGVLFDVCVTVVLAMLSLDFFTHTPILYWSLRRDSRFWRQVGIPDSMPLLDDTSSLQPLLGSFNEGHYAPGRMGRMLDGGRFDRTVIIDFSELVYGKRIGSGSAGSVFIGNCRGRKCAIKVLHVMEFTKEFVEDFCREAEILRRMRHRNVVKFIGVSIAPPDFALVTELCATSSLLHELEGWTLTPSSKLIDGRPVRSARERRPMPSKRMLLITKQIAKALEYLHKYGVLHRDLKPSNILFVGKKNDVVKLADFGLATCFDVEAHDDDQYDEDGSCCSCACKFGKKEGEETRRRLGSRVRKISSSRVTAPVGTGPYMAPELQEGDMSTKLDVFSFGMIVWELSSGKRPMELRRSLSENMSWATRQEILEEQKIHPLWQQLIIACTQERRWDRPNMGQVLLMLSAVDEGLKREKRSARAPPVPTPPPIPASPSSNSDEPEIRPHTCKLSEVEDPAET